jgi:hypothetical protein
VDAPKKEARLSDDDYFVFQDLAPSTSGYDFRVDSSLYQSRSFNLPFPVATPTEVAFDGEDEIALETTAVNLGQKRVSFEFAGFLPRIRKGSPVFGPAGFASTLTEELVGVAPTSAALASATGLVPGNFLRIVRSRSLIAKPGPYYPFPPTTTLVAMHVVEDAPGEAPLAGARATLKKVNGSLPATTAVGTVLVQHVTLAGLPPNRLFLGKSADLESRSDERGNLVFYFPGNFAITSLDIELARQGYVTQALNVSVTAGARTSVRAKLVPS